MDSQIRDLLLEIQKFALMYLENGENRYAQKFSDFLADLDLRAEVLLTSEDDSNED